MSAAHTKSILGIFVWVGVFVSTCYGYSLLENENLAFFMDAYFRQDIVTFKNVTGLDSSNKDDRTVYLGIDYSLGFHLESKDTQQKFFLKLERNGPYDYDAPIFVHNTLLTSGGVIEKYRDEELLPQVEELWWEKSGIGPLGLKIGLYPYSVGNGFALNGGYENYGATIFQARQDFVSRFYYCRPDINYKFRLGPKIRQEIEQGIQYEHNAANFFALDAKFCKDNNYFWPYIGALVDYTSFGKRDNEFSNPIKRDILGTVGLALRYEQGEFCWNMELAHNFGGGQSQDASDKDISHTGYLFYVDAAYKIDKVTPTFKFLLCSGNKVTPDMAENGDTKLTSGKNRAFSYASPFNKRLTDSISSANADMLPIVAMGGGYGLNYGIPRPGTFFAADFDNLIMPCLGVDIKLTDSIDLGIFGYYLNSFEPGVGTLNGEGRYLSRELGYESDLFIDYKLDKNTTLSFLGGYFFPGKYYREERDDREGSLFSPFLRGDGHADSAYQMELALEFIF
ncbi:MAG: hypothetical protein ABSB18_04865 [Candidatus Omnitrophota bacterium]